MASGRRTGYGGPSEPGLKPAAESRWRDRKRLFWLLAALVPSLVAESWFLVQVTGQDGFWWSGPILTFIVIPLLDHLVGADAENPPDSAMAWLENDRFYRWVNFLYLPGQYLSIVFACWIWAGGGWVRMSLVDKLGLMVTVGIIGGIAISTAHELGHRRAGL